MGENPNGASLTLPVCETIPPIEKQHITVVNIFFEALSLSDHRYHSSRRDQNFLYIGSKGGVGKSRIIKEIVASVDLIHHKNNVILMAPAGAAAGVMKKHILYLPWTFFKLYRQARVGRVRRLWSLKTIMINIDKVSLVDLFTLSTINTHRKTASSLEEHH